MITFFPEPISCFPEIFHPGSYVLAMNDDVGRVRVRRCYCATTDVLVVIAPSVDR